MKIKPIQTPADQITFGYHSPLKTLYKKDRLPVEYGFYGDKLTLKNVTLEHLLPVSKGGKTVLSNLVLASKTKNQLRGNEDVANFIIPEAFEKYINQFIGFRTKDFDGNKYVSMILEIINRLLDKSLVK